MEPNATTMEPKDSKGHDARQTVGIALIMATRVMHDGVQPQRRRLEPHLRRLGRGGRLLLIGGCARRAREGIEASRTIIPHPTVVQLADGTTVQRGELAGGSAAASSSSGGTGVLALPAPRHEMGGMVPNADQMRLALQLREEPAPLMLEHRPQQPSDPDGDGGQKEGAPAARAESALVLAARLVAHLSDAHARGHLL